MARPIKDPADHNKKKVMFLPTVGGTLLERLASLEIDSAHAKPVSLNWDFGNEQENLLIMRVILLDSEDRWLFQTSTSGWRGFWVADSLIKGETYRIWFQHLDIEVPFIMPSGKV